MTQGISGTYAVDNVEFQMQPTTGRWLDRNNLGFSGEGRPMYPAPREFEIRWNFMTMAEFNQIQTAFNAVRSSGTAVMDLPKYAATPYQFYSYSGTLLQEPTAGEFFIEHVSDVVLIVSNIRGT